MNPIEILHSLKTLPGLNMSEVYHCTTFKGYRQKKAGGMQEVTVTIMDAGHSTPGGRYHCAATSDDGRSATGNGHDSLDVALHIVHWGDLDRDNDAWLKEAFKNRRKEEQ